MLKMKFIPSDRETKMNPNLPQILGWTTPKPKWMQESWPSSEWHEQQCSLTAWLQGTSGWCQTLSGQMVHSVPHVTQRSRPVILQPLYSHHWIGYSGYTDSYYYCTVIVTQCQLVLHSLFSCVYPLALWNHTLLAWEHLVTPSNKASKGFVGSSHCI